MLFFFFDVVFDIFGNAVKFIYTYFYIFDKSFIVYSVHSWIVLLHTVEEGGANKYLEVVLSVEN